VKNWFKNLPFKFYLHRYSVVSKARKEEEEQEDKENNTLPPIDGAFTKKKKAKFTKKKKAELKADFQNSTKKIITNLQDGEKVATADLRKGRQREVAASSPSSKREASSLSASAAWGGGNKKGNKMGAVEVSAPSRTPSRLRGGGSGSKRSTSTAPRRKHFHEARDNLYGISETGDEVLKTNFKQSILEMRYNRNFFQPQDRSKEKNKRIDVENEEVEEEIAVMRKRKDPFAYTREVEFGEVWGKACFELGDLLLEGKAGHEELKAAVEEVLKRYFIEIKETFRLYGMSASEMVTAEGVRHQVGLYKLNPVDPALESAWFQPLKLERDILVSSLCVQIHLVPLQPGLRRQHHGALRVHALRARGSHHGQQDAHVARASGVPASQSGPPIRDEEARRQGSLGDDGDAKASGKGGEV
jgi:hypothetical protein